VPSLLFGGAAVGLTYLDREAYYIKLERLVYVVIRVRLTAKGSSTGNATIAGLPFNHDFGTLSPATGPLGYGTGYAALTSAPTYWVGTSNINLVQWGAAGVSSLTHANFTDHSDGSRIEAEMVDSKLHVFTRLQGRPNYSAADVALQEKTFAEILDRVSGRTPLPPTR
jgi:hypothetical protein